MGVFFQTRQTQADPSDPLQTQADPSDPSGRQTCALVDLLACWLVDFEAKNMYLNLK